MFEDAFEAITYDNGSVDPTFDAEASEKKDEDDVGEMFCEDFVLLLDSDQRICLGIFYHFNWKNFLS